MSNDSKRRKTAARRSRVRSRQNALDQNRDNVLPKKILSPEQAALRDKYFQFGAFVVLLIFGVYYAKTLFGFNVMPVPDWHEFVKLTQELLAFKVPTSFKRLPALGLMYAFITNFVGGDQPWLTSSWILNALMGVLSIVLFWRIGRQIIGDTAIWLSMLIVLVPHVVRLQTQPIVEITMIAFSAITFLLGSFEFIEQIRTKKTVINIFRLRDETE